MADVRPAPGGRRRVHRPRRAADGADGAGLPARGRRYVTLAVGCTGGKHRRVAIAEELVPAAARRRRRRPSSCTATWGGSDWPHARRSSALGGGHGLAASLAALRPRRPTGSRRSSRSADDGGSVGPAARGVRRPAPGRPADGPGGAVRRRPSGATPGRDVLQHRFAGAGPLRRPRAGQPAHRLASGTCSATPSRGLDLRRPAARRPGPGAADGGRPAADRGRASSAPTRPSPTRSRTVRGQVQVASTPGGSLGVRLHPQDPKAVRGDHRAPSTTPTGSSSGPGPGSPR